MKYVFTLALVVFAGSAALCWAQTPAPSIVPGAPETTTACADSRTAMESPCNVNITTPECLTAKQVYTACMADFEAANGQGPCAQQNTIKLQFCTADTSSQQCHNATASYNSCLQNPPGS